MIDEEQTKQFTMDRVGDRLIEIEAQWRALLDEWQPEDPAEQALKEQMDQLRQNYANLITPAHRKNWRYKALANGLEIPPEDITGAETDPDAA